MNSDDEAPELSLVIAVLNERENIDAVCRELASVRGKFPPSEIVFVDDGSTDGTVDALLAARGIAGLEDLRILSHDRRCGKSGALRTGIRGARGQWIATLDGDGQDDPEAIIALYERVRAANGRPPLVVGVRPRRQDTIWRKIATRFANGLRKRLLNDGCPDTGAPMKLFLRSDFLNLPQFEGLHRFLPALLQTYGVPLVCVPVRHRPRLHGHSKYSNFGRAVVGVRDVLGVMWLRNRTRLPVSVREC